MRKKTLLAIAISQLALVVATVFFTTLYWKHEASEQCRNLVGEVVEQPVSLGDEPPKKCLTVSVITIVPNSLLTSSDEQDWLLAESIFFGKRSRVIKGGGDIKELKGQTAFVFKFEHEISSP